MTHYKRHEALSKEVRNIDVLDNQDKIRDQSSQEMRFPNLHHVTRKSDLPSAKGSAPSGYGVLWASGSPRWSPGMCPICTEAAFSA